jgi:hypothetical protein
MLIREAIHRILAGDADVSAMIGTKIHRFKLPQSERLPAICFFITGVTNETTLAFEERAHDESAEWRVRVISQGNTDSEVEELDEKVRLAMHGWTGLLEDENSPETVLGIQGIFTENVRDSYDDVTRTPVIIRDFVVRAAELRPQPLTGE